jgi:mutator protein MutT
MKQVAKMVIIDGDDTYLLMYRNAHPTFGNDADLPGGTLEDGEGPVGAVVREVYEEAGVVVAESELQIIYEGTGYSERMTHYSLYATRLSSRPVVATSWEHSTYEWLDRDAFLEKVKTANDNYMRMVYDTLSNYRPSLQS